MCVHIHIYICIHTYSSIFECTYKMGPCGSAVFMWAIEVFHVFLMCCLGSHPKHKKTGHQPDILLEFDCPKLLNSGRQQNSCASWKQKCENKTHTRNSFGCCLHVQRVPDVLTFTVLLPRVSDFVSDHLSLNSYSLQYSDVLCLSYHIFQ